jgi:hypothetical protein
VLEIRTGELKTRKKVLIDGQEYIVRKLGAGEELSLSQAMRRLEKLSKIEEAGTITEEESDEALRLAESTFNILAGTFNDGGDGSKSKALINQLSEAELKEVYDTIFKEDIDGTEVS